MKNDIIVGLDIGTTKIACFIGQRAAEGKVRIIGFGRTESIGVDKGVVINIIQTANSIRKAVKAASEQAGVEVTEVYVGIAGQHIKSLKNHGEILINNERGLVTQADVDALHEQQRNIISLEPGSEIIHVFAQSYFIDKLELDQRMEPVGCQGKCLSANFHIVTANKTNLQNINDSVTEAGLKVKGVVLEPIASALAVLNERERQGGAALVDIGGGTTDVAIFYEDTVRHTSVLAVAGNAITNDIRKGCNIMKDQAELLKVKFGSCLPSAVNDDDNVAIPGIRNQPPREINMKYLAGIINARTKMILEQAGYEISLSKYDTQLIGGIVLTGGGSKLKHIKELCDLTNALETRIGTPDEHIDPSTDKNIIAELSHPMYATGIGLVLYGIDVEDNGDLYEAEEPEMIEPKKEEPKTNDAFHILDGMPTKPAEPIYEPEPEPEPEPLSRKEERRKKKEGKREKKGGDLGKTIGGYLKDLFAGNLDEN